MAMTQDNRALMGWDGEYYLGKVSMTHLCGVITVPTSRVSALRLCPNPALPMESSWNGSRTTGTQKR